MITIMESAVVPNAPSRPRVTLDYTLGALVGLLGGLILAFLFENMDTRLHFTSEIETAAQATSLAKIPKTGKARLILSQNGSSRFAESVRHLAAQIQWLNLQHPRKVILLTGAEPGQGTSTVTVNLASALAEQGKNVAIVDCNLRHPQMDSLLGLSNEHGLTDVVGQNMELTQALQATTDGHISVLTTGPVPAASLLAFDSARTEKILTALRQRFEFVLLDAPALTVADVASLAPSADGLILVVRRSHARREAIQSAGKFLSRFENKYIGLIVNEVEVQAVTSYS
jgi:capsular exopolysaccharide synthesis family protein